MSKNPFKIFYFLSTSDLNILFFSICRNKWRKLEILVDLGEIGKGVEGVTRKGSIAIFLPIQK